MHRSERFVGGEEVEAVLAASAGLTDDGTSVLDLYESALALYFRSVAAVAVSSDSGAITVLLEALKIAANDEILVCYDAPAWVLGALDQARVKITWLRELGGDSVLKLGTKDEIADCRFKAVLCGACDSDGADLQALRGLADGIAVPFLLDLTQLLTVSATVASLVDNADVAFIATGEGQSILSTGEGGALLFRDAGLAERARSFAHFGRLDGIRLGVNHKISPVQAALGCVRLRQIFVNPVEPSRCLDKLLAVRADRQEPRGVTELATPLVDRFDPRSPSDEAEIACALAGDISGASETVRRYEHALARWFGAPYALTVSSGYAAVVVALAALNLRPGDEVLLAPTCPLCTVFALTFLGVTPVFCDTEPDSFSLNLEQARCRLSARTRAVMDVPMWGYPVRADKTADFARENHLFYVLDLALGHGIELDGRLIWNYADIATFSTHSSKILVTGEGGFVLCRRADLAERVQACRHYDGGCAGLNFRLGGLQAALGLSRLPALSDHIQHRRQLMHDIAVCLDNVRLSPFPQVSGGTACGVKMLIRDQAGAGEALNMHLAAHGIPSDILTYRCRPLYEFPILSEMRNYCPNATRLLSSIATLPVHPDVNATMRDRMIAALNSYGEERV